MPMFDLSKKIYIALAVIGVGDVSYLTYEYLTFNFSSCSFKDTIWSCESVATSGHTALLGIPFWTAGLVWFPLMLIIGLLAFRYSFEIVLLMCLMIGNIFTIYLWYLELGVIHAICPVCVSLYFVNYALTGIVVWMLATE